MPGALSWAAVTAVPRVVPEPAPSRSAAPLPPPPTLEHVRPCTCLHADEMRSILSDMAASLRAELKELVADAIAPFLAASSAACDRIERARGITSRAEVLSDVVLPIRGASSPAPSPSLCGDEAVHVDEAVRLLPEMKLNGGPEPCHEITSPCPSQAGSFELDGIDATPSHVGLRQSLSFGVAPTQLFAEDAVAVERTIVNEDSEPSRDAGVQELVSSAPTFIESITARITAPLLSAAPPTPATPIRRRPRNPAPMPSRQASDRRAVTSMAGLSTVEKARRVLRKKWGLPAEDEAKGDATEEVLQQRFMDLFKDPKTALETEAVRALFGRVGSSRSAFSKKAGRRATPTTAARAAEDLELEPPVEAHSRE